MLRLPGIAVHFFGLFLFGCVKNQASFLSFKIIVFALLWGTFILIRLSFGHFWFLTEIRSLFQLEGRCEITLTTHAYVSVYICSDKCCFLYLSFHAIYTKLCLMNATEIKLVWTQLSCTTHVLSVYRTWLQESVFTLVNKCLWGKGNARAQPPEEIDNRS